MAEVVLEVTAEVCATTQAKGAYWNLGEYLGLKKSAEVLGHQGVCDSTIEKRRQAQQNSQSNAGEGVKMIYGRVIS